MRSEYNCTHKINVKKLYIIIYQYQKRIKTMSSFKEAAMSFAVKKAVKYARKDFDKNAPKILSLLEAADVKR